MRMAYFLKGGDLDALGEIFWARVGTSGGIGLPPGSVVVSSVDLMADLRPYRLLNGANGVYWFDEAFPAGVREAILAANPDAGYPIVRGRTVSGNDFFLEQFRLDGAICMETAESKFAWLNWMHRNGVSNIEMEGAMFAGYLNHWGFDRFAMVCCNLLDRLEGDQVTAGPEQLHDYSERAGEVLFNYLRSLS
jgi:uridine phosphorylase